MSKNGKLDQGPAGRPRRPRRLGPLRLSFLSYSTSPGVLVFVLVLRLGEQMCGIDTRNLRTGTRIFEIQNGEDELLQLRRPDNRRSQLG